MGYIVRAQKSYPELSKIMFYIKTFLDFITLHPTLAYSTICLISLSESLALIGLFIPGTVMMFGIGAIVATGSLALKPVLLLAAIGAIAGDGISYWLGHHYHEKIRGIWPFYCYPSLMKNGETFFHEHGGKSILFGRFVGPVRPIIPVVAGMLGMPPLRFISINVLSAIGWAFITILPGVFFGTSLAVAGAVSSRLALFIVILLATLWGFVWLSHKLAKLVEHNGPLWLASLKNWVAETTPSYDHRVVLSVKRLISNIFLRRQGEEWFIGFLVLILFGAVWGFLGVLQDVLAKDPLVIADQAVYNFFQTLRTPWADHILVAVTELGDSFVNICLSVAVLLVLFFKRCYRTAGYWLLTVLGGLIGVQVLKWLIHLPRPVALYQGSSTYGFPSGHTTMSVIIYGFLAILIARKLSSTLRWRLFVTVFAISFFIALSRLYLGVHWLSDVLGGFLIGTSWTTLLGIAYIKGSHDVVPRRLLGITTIVVIVVTGGWYVTQHHKNDLTFYAPKKTILSMEHSRWLADGWQELPAWQIDMGGEKEQPLTLQRAGSLDEIAKYLVASGWQHTSPLSVKSFLGMFSPDTKIEDLPVLPKLHDGRIDSLLLIRDVLGQRLVLRIWPTDLEISPHGIPLFTGTIEVEYKQHTSGLLTLARDIGEYDLPLQTLQKELSRQFAVQVVNRKAYEVQLEHEQPRLQWNGNVLLIWDK